MITTQWVGGMQNDPISLPPPVIPVVLQGSFAFSLPQGENGRQDKQKRSTFVYVFMCVCVVNFYCLVTES